jgi:predicted XRE-type DNA-binding protein
LDIGLKNDIFTRKPRMIAVITGDIINSRKGEVEKWIYSLKEVLNYYGKEPKDWEIFRGDSFQLSIAPEKAMLAAIHIKSVIKQTKLQDVRMAIGIGEEKYSSSKITESNGSAYIRSGECFESLKKQTLAIMIKTSIENSEKNQKSLAKLLKKSQSTVSEALKRGGFEEIMHMNIFYKSQISKSC